MTAQSKTEAKAPEQTKRPEPFIEIDRVRLGYPIHNMGTQTVAVGGNVHGQTFSGIVQRILQLPNGNLLVEVKPPGDGRVRSIIFTPPYQADLP